MSNLSRSTQWIRFAQFISLPLITVLGAAWATRFPTVDPMFSDETRALQYSAMTAGFASGLAVAIFFPFKVFEKRNRLIKHIAIVLAALLGAHFLWVEPIWGFHHEYSLGIFAWLFIGGEDGFSIFPNIIGVSLSVAASYIAVKTLRLFSNSQRPSVAKKKPSN